MEFSLVFLLFLFTSSGYSARILGLFPLPSKSHYFLGNALLRGLAEKGHDVTMISPYQDKNPPQNGSYRDIVLAGMLEEAEKRRHEINMYEVGDMNPFLTVLVLSSIMSEAGELGLKNVNVQKLLKSNEKFDAVIVEQFYNDAHKAVAAHFDAPLILFSTIGANYWVNPLVGNPAPPSYVPDSLLSYSSSMTFCERLINTLVYVLNEAVFHLYVFPRQNKAIQSYMPNPRQLNDVLYNASIVLLNSHASINQAVPHVPNMIEIGGFHVKPAKKLPSDLQKYLDEAEEGVIYFSMGSNLRSADLPLEKREALLKSFSKLKQKVLWKWEDDVLPNQPNNVRLGKWWPQNDILAHPNVKLFVTHGGLLSTTETIYHGVPVLVIPIFGDQKLNANRAVNGGFGLSVPYRDLTEQRLTNALEELISNPKFRSNAKSKSIIFHDRQNKPLDTATYWIEYVIRNKGAPHLRVAALDLPWYQYYLLDVILIIGIASLIIVLVGFWITKKIFQKLCSKKRAKQPKFKTN